MQYKLAYIAFLIPSFPFRSHYFSCPACRVAVVILAAERTAVGCGTGACTSTQAQTGADGVLKRWVAALPLARFLPLMALACHVAPFVV